MQDLAHFRPPATPWPGHFSQHDPKLAYNHVHSSLRQSIERAFGMLCRKWLLLKRTFASHQIRRTKRCAGPAVFCCRGADDCHECFQKRSDVTVLTS